MGVSTSTLLLQRRAVAAATAPASGGGGQSLNMALILADASLKGRADPAFDAHTDPIVSWASATWSAWLPPRALQLIMEKAISRLSQTDHIWAAVRGPAAAVVASLWRLGWTIRSARRVV